MQVFHRAGLASSGPGAVRWYGVVSIGTPAAHLGWALQPRGVASGTDAAKGSLTQ